MRWFQRILRTWLRPSPSKSPTGEAKLRRLLSRRISHRFSNPALLERALTHRSSLARNAPVNVSNERLEFLGDAVLALTVVEALYRRFPREPEGVLTRMKSHIVSRDRLADEADRIELGRHLILSAGEDQSGGRHRQSICADAYEALLGAVYLDGGLEAAKRFVQKGLLKNAGRSREYKHQKNYKSWLLEHVQALGNGAPRYRVTAEDGPDHIKEFTVEVVVRSEVMGLGKGGSKKKAEQAAAKAAIEKLGLL
jgi:ribonuclease III